jgi:hypothetical protein
MMRQLQLREAGLKLCFIPWGMSDRYLIGGHCALPLYQQGSTVLSAKTLQLFSLQLFSLQLFSLSREIPDQLRDLHITL